MADSGSGIAFLLDESIPKVLAVILRDHLCLNVTHLLDRFPSGTEDAAWLPTVGKEGLVLVTSDRAMTRRKLEKKALERYHVTTFFLYEGFSRLTRLKQIGFLTWRWERIMELASTARSGERFRIPERGEMKPD